MVRDLEEALHTSSEGLQAYQGFLEQPPPPLRPPGSQTTGTTQHRGKENLQLK